MSYSDNLQISRDVELLLRYFGESPFVPVGQKPPPPMTRAEVIEAVRAEHGDRAAHSVRITVH
ncbi:MULTISPECIES: hypothetical protein [unclassified Bradyrhizobium]|uniref:hypothetical protein n=1 Tax=unclassified Bradyrhizobium TaxID=2631580 RepID=UPI0028E8D547|nr:MULTISPECIES: hypothetical protein [unclassified Bradyrhizobium]